MTIIIKEEIKERGYKVGEHNKVISKIIYICTAVLLISKTVVMADTTIPTIKEEASEQQYFELNATTINDVEGQNKQVIMELWGYDVEFKRI